jgi:plastocyanin domain-containing protein
MKTRQIAAVGAALCLLAWFGASAQVSAREGAPAKAKAQVVRLSVNDKGDYQVTPDTVVAGVPVRMEVDLESVRGCSRTVVIGAVNVKKTVKEGEAVIEFTPTKAGKVQLACGMDMVHGSFTVTDKK